jgi:hypothetical protein
MDSKLFQPTETFLKLTNYRAVKVTS